MSTSLPTGDVDSYPRQSARTQRFRLGVPRLVTVSPDGRRIVFLRSLRGDDAAGALWVVDVTTEQERLVSDPRDLGEDGAGSLAAAERARRERMRQSSTGIVEYSTDHDVTRAAFALHGRTYVVDLMSLEPARLLPVAGPALDPQLSPDGAQVAFVVDGSVRLAAWDGTDERVLAEPEGEDVSYGLADFVAAEELGRSSGMWWSPRSDALVVERVDNADVALWWIADPVHPERRPEPHRYPAAGTSNPSVTVHLLRLDGSHAEIPWDHDRFCYLADVSWTVAGDPLVVLLDRSQRHRMTLAVEPTTATTRVVAEHTDPDWVDSAPGRVRWAQDGRLLAIVADHGVDAYRLTLDGEAVSARTWQVDAILDVGPHSVLLRVQTHSSRAKVAELDLTTSALRRLTEVDSWETGRRGGSTVVITSTTWKSTRTTVTVHRGDGSSFELRSLAETPVVQADLRAGSTLLLAGARELPVAVMFPRGHTRGSRRLPVVMSPYGGPGHAEVVAALGSYGEDQWIADQGFVVVVADGRGTPGRGPAWDRAIAGDLATVPLADQVAALATVVETFPADVDPDRVGIRGWSFGGYLAALAVLRRPDVFHAAVAGAPVTDWRRYDTAYTERYLGHPDEHPEAYDASSLLADAPNLTRPLLLMHGMTDDNVVVAHTLALSAALTAAGRPHTVLPLSGVTHMTPQAAVAENKLRLELDFLRTHLGS